MKITVCDICGTKDNLSEKTYKISYTNSVTYDLCIECELRAKKQFIHKLLLRGMVTAEDYGKDMRQIINEFSQP